MDWKEIQRIFWNINFEGGRLIYQKHYTHNLLKTLKKMAKNKQSNLIAYLKMQNIGFIKQ